MAEQVAEIRELCYGVINNAEIDKQPPEAVDLARQILDILEW